MSTVRTTQPKRKLHLTPITIRTLAGPALDAAARAMMSDGHPITEETEGCPPHSNTSPESIPVSGHRHHHRRDDRPAAPPPPKPQPPRRDDGAA